MEYYGDEGGMIIGGEYGGKYRTKAYNTSAKAKKHFLEILDERHYQPRGAKSLWGKEEKNPRNLKSLAHVYKARVFGPKKPTKKQLKGEGYGGEYHRKGNTVAKDKASFIRGIMRLGYSEKSAEKGWENEQKKDRKIGTIAHYYAASKSRKPRGLKSLKKSEIMKALEKAGIPFKKTALKKDLLFMLENLGTPGEGYGDGYFSDDSFGGMPVGGARYRKRKVHHKRKLTDYQKFVKQHRLKGNR